MSVTIKWRPTSDRGKSFKGGTSSSFDKLKKACGTTLSEGDVSKLRAMAIATDDPFYDEIADKIEEVGSIEIWGDY
jgi:hypothetical protein